MFGDLSVVIPAYNEAKVISAVLEGLISYDRDLEIIVVDDGSTDDTSMIAKKFATKVIRHPENIGYGAALKSGIRAATHDKILIMDSDGQHRNFSDIQRLYAFSDEYDMVVCARMLGYKWPLVRRLGKWFLNRIASYLVEKDIPDLNSGFRLFKKNITETYFHILSNEFSFTSTLTLTFIREGFRVRYVPVEVDRRRGQRSTVKFLRHGLGTLVFILRVVTLFNPLRVFVPTSLFLFTLGCIRLIQGLLRGVDNTITAVIGIVSAIIIFMFGLLADQISALRRERLSKF